MSKDFLSVVVTR